jgi:hypothetical protein
MPVTAKLLINRVSDTEAKSYPVVDGRMQAASQVVPFIPKPVLQLAQTLALGTVQLGPIGTAIPLAQLQLGACVQVLTRTVLLWLSTLI